MVYQIPLTSIQQEFDIDLGEATYHIKVFYNKIMGAWCVDLSDENKQPITQCMPLVTGANPLEQLRYKGLGGVFLLYTEGAPDHMPNLNELGTLTTLYWMPIEDK